MALDHLDPGRGAFGEALEDLWARIGEPGGGPGPPLVGGRDLIRVAVARDPSQAIPLAGSFTGPADAFLGMTVEVQVTAGG